MRAGRVDIDRKWHEADAPDAQFASVFNASDQVFLTARDQRDVLVSSGAGPEWSAFPLPSRTAEVSSVAVDPFTANRVYVGTLREGLFVFEGAPQKYDAKPAAETASGAASYNNRLR